MRIGTSTRRMQKLAKISIKHLLKKFAGKGTRLAGMTEGNGSKAAQRNGSDTSLTTHSSSGNGPKGLPYAPPEEHKADNCTNDIGQKCRDIGNRKLISNTRKDTGEIRCSHRRIRREENRKQGTTSFQDIFTRAARQPLVDGVRERERVTSSKGRRSAI